MSDVGGKVACSGSLLVHHLHLQTNPADLIDLSPAHTGILPSTRYLARSVISDWI